MGFLLCLIGTMVQETYDSSPTIRDACAASIFGHAAALEPDIAEAMTLRGIEADRTPASLAAHTQALLQEPSSCQGDRQPCVGSPRRRSLETLFDATLLSLAD